MAGLSIAAVALVASGLVLESRAEASAPRPFSGKPELSTQPIEHAATAGLTHLRFEENHGQFEPSIRYLARTRGFGLYLTEDGATFALQRGITPEGAMPPGAEHEGVHEPQVVSMQIVGARAVQPRGVQPLEGRSNYFVGGDASRWRQNVPSFGRVRYEQVLPGVDVVYYGTTQGELEYDFEVQPGADVLALQVEYTGVLDIDLTPGGDALLELEDGGVLRKRAPVAYQRDDLGARVPVAAAFRKLANNRLGFALSGYDPARALVIDPVLTYATYLGGSRFDEFFGVAANSAGETWAVGYTTGTLFPTRSPYQAAYGGGSSDAVIVKFNSTGSQFVFSTYLGGSGTDQAYSVGIDGSGNAYVTGVTYSTNFPTLSAFQAAHGGGLQDAFVAKFTSTGTLAYSTFLGGSQDDFARGIAVHPLGSVYLVGTTFSGDFPLLNAVQGTLSGTSDAFVANLSSAGNSLVYSTFLGGSAQEYGHAIAVDVAGAAFVAGQSVSTDFPSVSAVQATYGGGASDAFVSKLAPGGSSLQYSSYLGGSGADSALAITHSAGAAYVVGSTSSLNFPVSAGAAQPIYGGSGDGFLSRFSTTGEALSFSTFLGGSASDVANGVILDTYSSVYVLGQTSSSDYPLRDPLEGQSTLKGGSDAFITAFGIGTGQQVFSTYLGGNGDDRAVAAARRAESALHIVGNTNSTNFPVITAPFASPLGGGQDGFFVKLTVIFPASAPAVAPSVVLFAAALLLVLGVFAVSLRRLRS
jgi:hypothetical protein